MGTAVYRAWQHGALAQEHGQATKPLQSFWGASFCPLFLHNSTQGSEFVLLDTAGTHRAPLEAVGLAKELLYPFFTPSEWQGSS